MAIARKPQAKSQEQVPSVDIDALIAKGGSVGSSESTPKDDNNGVGSFTLRVPKNLLRQIKQQTQDRPIKTDRQRWILEAIVEKLERDSK